MKLFRLLLLALPILSISCVKHVVVITEDEMPDNVFYLNDEIKPFSGKCLIYYHGTEIVKEEMHFKEGLLNGSHVSYYKTGCIKRRGSYLNGNYNGKWSGFDAKGNKTFEVEYQNDSLIGTYVNWYSTGVIKVIGTYFNNHRIGEWISYDEAGMILSRKIL